MWLLTNTYEYEYLQGNGDFRLKEGTPPLGAVEVNDLYHSTVRIARGTTWTSDLGGLQTRPVDFKAHAGPATTQTPLLDPTVQYEWIVPKPPVDVIGKNCTLEATMTVDTNTFLDAKAWEFELNTEEILRNAVILGVKKWGPTGYSRKALFVIAGVIAENLPVYRLKFKVAFNYGISPLNEDTFSVSGFASLAMTSVRQTWRAIMDEEPDLRTESVLGSCSVGPLDGRMTNSDESDGEVTP